MLRTCYSCRILVKLEISRQIFKKKKNSDINFHQRRSSGSRAVSCGWTDGRKDRYDEANSRFSQF
jgi:hypothetical protein